MPQETMKASDAADTTYGRWFRPLPISNSELKRLSPDQPGQASGIRDPYQDAGRSTVVESRNVVPKEQLAKVNNAVSPPDVKRFASTKYVAPSPHGGSPSDSSTFRRERELRHRPMTSDSASKLSNTPSGDLPRQMLWDDTVPSSIIPTDSVTTASPRLQQWIPHSPKSKGTPKGQENGVLPSSKPLDFKKEPFGISRPQNGASPGCALAANNLEKSLLSSLTSPPSDHHQASVLGHSGSWVSAHLVPDGASIAANTISSNAPPEKEVQLLREELELARRGHAFEVNRLAAQVVKLDNEQTTLEAALAECRAELEKMKQQEKKDRDTKFVNLWLKRMQSSACQFMLEWRKVARISSAGKKMQRRTARRELIFAIDAWAEAVEMRRLEQHRQQRSVEDEKLPSPTAKFQRQNTNGAVRAEFAAGGIAVGDSRLQALRRHIWNVENLVTVGDEELLKVKDETRQMLEILCMSVKLPPSPITDEGHGQPGIGYFDSVTRTHSGLSGSETTTDAMQQKHADELRQIQERLSVMERMNMKLRACAELLQKENHELKDCRREDVCSGQRRLLDLVERREALECQADAFLAWARCKDMKPANVPRSCSSMEIMNGTAPTFEQPSDARMERRAEHPAWQRVMRRASDAGVVETVNKSKIARMSMEPRQRIEKLQDEVDRASRRLQRHPPAAATASPSELPAANWTGRPPPSPTCSLLSTTAIFMQNSEWDAPLTQTELDDTVGGCSTIAASPPSTKKAVARRLPVELSELVTSSPQPIAISSSPCASPDPVNEPAALLNQGGAEGPIAVSPPPKKRRSFYTDHDKGEEEEEELSVLASVDSASSLLDGSPRAESPEVQAGAPSGAAPAGAAGLDGERVDSSHVRLEACQDQDGAEPVDQSGASTSETPQTAASAGGQDSQDSARPPRVAVIRYA